MKKIILLLLIMIGTITSNAQILGFVSVNNAGGDVAQQTYVFNGGASDYFSTTFDLNGLNQHAMVVEAKITNTTLETVLLGNAGSYDLYFRQGTGTTIQIVINGGGQSSDVGNWTSDGLLHQFGYSYDGATLKTYIDGIQNNSTNTTAFTGWVTSKLLQIGRRLVHEPSIAKAQMSRILIFNRALLPTEFVDINTDMDNVTSGRILDFNNNKNITTWTSDIGGYTATNAGGVTLQNK